jgi:hypothetical protein
MNQKIARSHFPTLESLGRLAPRFAADLKVRYLICAMMEALETHDLVFNSSHALHDSCVCTLASEAL